MVVKCQDCEKSFEPPFDSTEFKVWMDACSEVEKYLCFACADIDVLFHETVSIVEETMITQLPKYKNRLKLSGTFHSVECEAGYLPARGYFQLKPIASLGLPGKGGWQRFWDVWEIHKPELKSEGLSVRKEKGKWVIYYQPQGDIKLDERILWTEF